MTTWYVRPSGGSYGAEDGTSFDDAWDGFSNITWGGAGVVAGDTLYVYGTHDETLNPQASGSSGSPITIDCTNATFDRSTSANDIIINQRDYITVLYGTYNGSTANPIALRDCNNITLYGLNLSPSRDGSGGIQLYLTGAEEIHDIVIQNCYFDCLDRSLQIYMEETSSGAIYNIAIRSNEFASGRKHYQTFVQNPEVTCYTNGVYVEGFDMDGNLFTESSGSPCLCPCTKSTPGRPSYIRNNRFINCGQNVALTNIIQTNNCTDLIIENNYISGIEVGGTGDGHGIIIDWKSGDNSRKYKSKGTIVRGNYVEGMNVTNNASGIHIWVGSDTKVYGNIIENCKYGLTISDGAMSYTHSVSGWQQGSPTLAIYTQVGDCWPEIGDTVTISGVTNANSPVGDGINGTHTVLNSSSTILIIDFDSTGGSYSGGTFVITKSLNNSFYNNTVRNCSSGGMFIKWGAPASTWMNNIFDSCYDGIVYSNSYGSVNPTESYNIVYNSTRWDYNDAGGEGTLDSTDITTDPLLDASGKPTANSPVRRAGTSVGTLYDYNGRKYFGSNPSIGVYEFNSRAPAATRSTTSDITYTDDDGDSVTARRRDRNRNRVRG